MIFITFYLEEHSIRLGHKNSIGLNTYIRILMVVAKDQLYEIFARAAGVTFCAQCPTKIQ